MTRLSTLKTWLESQVFRVESQVFRFELLVIVQETQVILGQPRSFHIAKNGRLFKWPKGPRALGPNHLGLDHLGLDHPDLYLDAGFWCPKIVPISEVVPGGLVMGGLGMD